MKMKQVKKVDQSKTSRLMYKGHADSWKPFTSFDTSRHLIDRILKPLKVLEDQQTDKCVTNMVSLTSLKDMAHIKAHRQFLPLYSFSPLYISYFLKSFDRRDSGGFSASNIISIGNECQTILGNAVGTYYLFDITPFQPFHNPRYRSHSPIARLETADTYPAVVTRELVCHSSGYNVSSLVNIRPCCRCGSHGSIRLDRDF